MMRWEGDIVLGDYVKLWQLRNRCILIDTILKLQNNWISPPALIGFNFFDK